MRDQDQKFFDSFMLVVGILIGVAVALFFFVSKLAIDTQGDYVLDDPTVQAEINSRIQPIGKVVLLGSAELAAAQTAKVATPARVPTTLTGPQVYNEVCSACHGTGIAGAPALGDAAAWAPRVAQGRDTLVEHALNGYQGKTGAMPAKGGRVDLSDDEIASAVDFMLSQLDQQQ